VGVGLEGAVCSASECVRGSGSSYGLHAWHLHAGLRVRTPATTPAWLRATNLRETNKTTISPPAQSLGSARAACAGANAPT
jgi:hypothetical protein